MATLVPSIVIAQGDSIALSYGVTGVNDLTGWSCIIQVKSALTDTTPIYNQNVTDLNGDSTRFTHLIARSQTEDWEVGDYFIIADLWKVSTGESREVQSKLRVNQQGVANV